MQCQNADMMVEILKGTLRGTKRGAVTGAVIAVASGSAVLFTAPSWLPIVGGALLLQTSTIAAYSGAGAILGGAIGSARAYARQRELRDILAK